MKVKGLLGGLGLAVMGLALVLNGAALPYLVVLGTVLIGFGSASFADRDSRERLDGSQMPPSFDVFEDPDASDYAWDRNHPWMGTGWQGRIIDLRGKVRRGEVQAWEFEYLQNEILAQPENIYTEAEIAKGWVDRHIGPSNAQKLMVLGDPPRRYPILAQIADLRGVRAIREQDGDLEEVKRISAKIDRLLDEHARDNNRMGRGRKRVGKNRPVGYTVWKKGEGWVTNVEEVEEVSASGIGKATEVHNYVVGVEEMPSEAAQAVMKPSEVLAIRKQLAKGGHWR